MPCLLGLFGSLTLRSRAAIVTGSCYGGKTSEDAGFVALYRESQPRVNPMTIPRLMANAREPVLAKGAGSLCRRECPCNAAA